MEYLPIMIIMLVLQFILYHHLKLPISIVELSVKGIHIMQMLFYNAWRSYLLYLVSNVVKLLEILLEELTGPSIITSAAYDMKSLTTTIFHTSHQLNRTEDILPIFQIFQPRLLKF